MNIGTGATVIVQPLPSGKPIVVQAGAYFGRYVPNGHIVYMQDDTLFAVPFDPGRLEMTGSAVRTIDGVESDASRGSAQLAVSHAGYDGLHTRPERIRCPSDCVDGPHRDAHYAFARNRPTGRTLSSLLTGAASP